MVTVFTILHMNSPRRSSKRPTMRWHSLVLWVGAPGAALCSAGGERGTRNEHAHELRLLDGPLMNHQVVRSAPGSSDELLAVQRLPCCSGTVRFVDTPGRWLKIWMMMNSHTAAYGTSLRLVVSLRKNHQTINHLREWWPLSHPKKSMFGTIKSCARTMDGHGEHGFNKRSTGAGWSMCCMP